MTPQTPDPYRHKKIKGIFVIMVAISSTLAYNAFLLYHDRASVPAPMTSAPLSVDTNNTSEDTFTLAQVAEHATPENCWMAAFGNVYDLTEYVAAREHPGGQASLISGCGEEITNSFERTHSARAKEYLEAYKIGILSN